MAGENPMDEIESLFDRGEEIVLVVEDEPDIRDSLRGLLEDELPRISVVTAADGEDALVQLKSHRIDLMIVDYKLPGMDGLEFIAKTRETVRSLGRVQEPRVPRILITAYPDVDLAKRAINEGRIEKFFTKPLDPEELVAAVQQILYERPDRGLETT